MKRIFSLAVVIFVLVLGAKMLMAQTPMDMEVKNFGAPVYFWKNVTIPAGDLVLGGSVITPTNAFGGNLTVGNLTVATNAIVAGTLGVTGVVTFTVAPKVTVITAPGAVTLTMTNAPTVVSATSPTYINVTIGSTTYVVPAWAKP